jgi:hypothetical protein
MFPGDAESLATQVKDLLRNPQWASDLAVRALHEIGKYDWNRIAGKTIEVYGRNRNESCHNGGGKRNTFASIDMSSAKADGADIGSSLHGIHH